MSTGVQQGQLSRQHGQIFYKNICLKTFVIFVIASSALTVIAGVFALLASKGAFPNSVGAIAHISKIGIVNSILMLTGGVAFFVLGIAAWRCLSQKHKIYEQ